MSDEHSPAVLLVGGELMARSRVEEGARRAGLAVASVAATGLPSVAVLDRYALVILDLDGGGADLVERWASRESSARAIGYGSHVDEELLQRARAAGIEALPRGRFWRTLPDILAGV